ncbi:hypothetical protein SLIV_34770 [Streptomyces lividans TK24]|uniref:Amine oxidase, flavin-containing n=2 Tax=Streptomyces lividans TaxID=1916 RepID=A0A7U9DPE2_STRLI|nr:hypothetical protein SLIV_34770 [Streptomyces lividans TK24]EOY45322.1 Amine oxidase, flavin-containing [Streptomyces lividans 1326]QSJ13448.1 hypothetical protein SLIVDG2_34770 [Streptomyces lividans]QTD74358.1 hypothetical protein SLIVYQS_34770 [Streptomyces lividans TK24] [Streptomyces lividans]
MPRSSGESARRTAVVGGGVAGLTAAHILGRAHRVTLYEADDRLGGHAHTTRDLTSSDGRGHRVDSGFTVHNRRTTAAPTRTCCGSSTSSAPPPRSRR